MDDRDCSLQAVMADWLRIGNLETDRMYPTRLWIGDTYMISNFGIAGVAVASKKPVEVLAVITKSVSVANGFAKTLSLPVPPHQSQIDDLALAIMMQASVFDGRK